MKWAIFLNWYMPIFQTEPLPNFDLIFHLIQVTIQSLGTFSTVIVCGASLGNSVITANNLRINQWHLQIRMQYLASLLAPPISKSVQHTLQSLTDLRSGDWIQRKHGHSSILPVSH